MPKTAGATFLAPETSKPIMVPSDDKKAKQANNNNKTPRPANAPPSVRLNCCPSIVCIRDFSKGYTIGFKSREKNLESEIYE